MPRRSILSFLRGTIIGGNTHTFIDLEYEKDDIRDENKSDISRLNIKSGLTQTPSLHMDSSSNPEIPIIGIGGAGIRLLNKIVDRVKSYGMEYPVLGLDTDKKSKDEFDNISHFYHIPGSDLGTSHQFRVAASRTKKVQDVVTEEIRSYLRDLKMTYTHEIVFLLMGSGGTGVGVGIEIARVLKDIGKRPVPFLILPARDEMSRIKFNAAAALYYFNYAPKDRCLNLTTICIDNELFLSKNSKKHYSSVIAASNERIAATMGDIIATTELESHSYSADLNEFLEIFRDLKGIGVLQYLQIKNPSSNLLEQFEDNLENSLSVDVDIFGATRGYLYVSAKPDEISAEAYRNLMLRFDNSDIFSKLYETGSDDQDNFLAFRGIFTGIKYPSYIEQLMQLAEDARVEILNKEIDTMSLGKVNPKIDKLNSDEEIDVKTGQELVEERAKEYAKMRREGDS